MTRRTTRPFVSLAIVALVSFGLAAGARLVFAAGEATGRAAAAEIDASVVPSPNVAGEGSGPDVLATTASPQLSPAAPTTTLSPTSLHEATDPVGLLEDVWSLWKRGLLPPALMLLFHLTNTVALARWSWLSGRFPWLANGRWLAIVSAFQGATAGLVPLAIADALTAQIVGYALLTAVAQYFRPTPRVVLVPQNGVPQRIERAEMEIVQVPHAPAILQ